MWHTLWVLLTWAFFHWKSANFAIWRNTAIHCISNSLDFFFESLKIIVINMVTNLMMSPKMATLCFLRIRIFWNNVYYVIISIYDFTSKILSRDSNHTVDVVLCSKFCDSSISTREVITNSILQGFDLKKKTFLRRGLGSSSIIWDWH